MRIPKEVIIAVTAVVCVSIAGLFYISDRQKAYDVYELASVSAPAQSDDPEITKQAEEQDKRIKIYIAGAVASPGVYELDEGSRIEDALILAGGPTQEADMLRINLAARLKDEQQVIVPKEGEMLDKILLEVQNNDNDSLININTADEAKLMELPGVGQVTAKNIIAYRTEHGAFKSIEDIKNVSRIGEKTFDRLKDLIIVE